MKRVICNINPIRNEINKMVNTRRTPNVIDIDEVEEGIGGIVDVVDR